MGHRLRSLIHRTRTKADVIASCRRELAFWWPDASTLTDDEIEKGVFCFGAALAGCGVTVAEAGRAFRQLGLSSSARSSPAVSQHPV